MDAPTIHNEQMRFHVAGQRSGAGFAEVEVATLRPALLAPYRHLTRLRHDYPVVLPQAPGPDGCVLPLATVIGRLAAELAPRGLEGERLRRHLLRLEAEMRRMVDEGAQGPLAELWPLALARLPQGQGSDDDTARRVLAQAAESLKIDGELAPCDAALPARLLTRAWRLAQLEKSREYHRVADALMRKLSDIRRAAWVHSKAGMQAEALRAGVGGRHGELFDFAAMSRLVARRAPADELPAPRRQRIEWALGVLAQQRFWPDARAEDPLPAGNVFDNCAAAMEAFRERLPAAVELLKAIAIGELEAAGRYVEAEHDAVFARYDMQSLTADDFALLPDSLVCIPADRTSAPENMGLLEMLSSGMPAKVLVPVSDLMDEAALGTGRFAFGVRGARLATTAMGLGGMFVLQCTSAGLPAQKARIARGMSCRSPALFTVYAGSPAATAGIAPYLGAAAAGESRAFPTFCYDAAAGANWAARFTLAGNRQPEDDWPVEPFEYADDQLQRVVQPLAFTYADFALTDARCSAHFAPVPRDRWHDGMLPVADWLRLPEDEAALRLPYVLAVDGQERLHRVLVDARLMKATRERLLLWHRLQEHAGIHDSHAERLLAEERARQAAAAQAAAANDAVVPAAAAAAVPAAAASAAVATEEAASAPPSDEPWIETARCPSCNECQLVNPRMFAYNENKQAVIKDVNAGTYRDLVEAAESCQVAIIHPGKPRNPAEPGLAELVERARPFL
ncbi:MAG: ferredoxin [Rubrivivax sp.]|nr:ferredoxin [Rubrivivax sp.]